MENTALHRRFALQRHTDFTVQAHLRPHLIVFGSHKSKEVQVASSWMIGVAVVAGEGEPWKGGPTERSLAPDLDLGPICRRRSCISL